MVAWEVLQHIFLESSRKASVLPQYFGKPLESVWLSSSVWVHLEHPGALPEQGLYCTLLNSQVTSAFQARHFFFFPKAKNHNHIWVFWPIPLWIIANIFPFLFLYLWIVEDGYTLSLITSPNWKYLYVYKIEKKKIYILYLWQDAWALLSKKQLPEPTNLCVNFTSTKQGW